MAEEWQFDEYRDGRWDGWNSSQLALFKDNKLRNLTREILQNSLDNPKCKDGANPVVVKFALRKVEARNIPGHANFRDHLAEVLRASASDSPQARVEIVAAQRMAEREVIPVMEISDEFTTGMAGPCIVGSPFHNYLKSTGSSGGEQNRAGSHGQGKSAPLANSLFRVIFVSTMYKKDEKESVLFQGRCALMSRRKTETTHTSSVGFWGEANFEPYEFIPEQYSWMSREALGQGTSIFIVGWEDRKNWDLLMVAYAVESFFAAFYRGALEIEIGNYKVNKSNVADLLENQKLRDVLVQDGHDDDILDSANYYYRSLVHGELIQTQISPRPGHSRISLLVVENAPKKIAYIRNNIFITDRIPNFYKNSPGSLKDFAGVYECINDDGLSYLRLMEPPQHNSLSADWLPVAKREDGNRLLKALGSKLKTIVKERAEIVAGEGGEVEILKQFFADDAGDGREIAADEDIDPNGVFKLAPKAFKLPPPKPLGLFSDLDVPDEGPDETDDFGSFGGSRSGPGKIKDNSEGGYGFGEGSGEGGDGSKNTDSKLPANRIPVRMQRFIYTESEEATLSYVPSISGIQKLWVYEVGADGAEPIRVTQCSFGEVASGKVIVNVVAGAPSKIYLRFDRPIRGGLKIEVEA